MLRVHDLGLTRAQAEKSRVEQLGALQHAPRPHVPRVAQERRVDPRRRELLVAEERDRLHPVPQVAPELLQVLRARHAAGHPHDGDRLHPVLRTGLARAHETSAWAAARERCAAIVRIVGYWNISTIATS